MKPHPAGPLDQRLDNHRRRFAGDGAEKGIQPRECGFVGRYLDDMMPGQCMAKSLVHRPFGIRDGHRAEGVAVIAVREAQEVALFGAAGVEPVLQGDLERDFDGDRSRIREEDASQTRWDDRRQPLGQHQRRLMSQTAEHDMRHGGELPLDRLADMRMVVPVAGSTRTRCR